MKGRPAFLMLFLTILICNLQFGKTENSYQAPRFTTSSTTFSIIRLGTTKIMQCQAFGNPPPLFKWLKDGKPITEFSTDPYYKIISASRTDGGSYRCIASNNIGSIMSEEMKCTVAYMNTFEDRTEKTLTVKEGDAAIIALPPIESAPPPEITWQTEDGPLPYHQKYAKTQKDELVILAADQDDEKAYRARAINTQEGKEENSAYVRLKIQPTAGEDVDRGPEIVVPPSNVRTVQGAAQITLDCIANARPLHELTTLWYKDGIPIEETGVLTLNSDIWNRSLTLISLNGSHNGLYECRVGLKSEGVGRAKASAEVVVLEKPRFVGGGGVKAETLTEYGKAVVLACDVVGIPKPDVVWYKDGQEIGFREDRYALQEDHSLLIRRVLISDDGMYQCFARNEAGESSISTWLRVKTSTPVLELPPQNQTVLDGKDATLTCRAVGAPMPNITWIYNNKQEITTSNRLQILDNGDLLIAAVKESDSGLYTCQRKNEAGHVEASAYLTVLVRTQIIQPPVDTRVLLGHTATLQCKISSDPAVPYKLQWYRDKQSIDPEASQRVNFLDDGTLEIRAVRASDVGVYTCAVRSTGGNDTRSARLSVIELPFAPTNVKAMRVDGDGIQKRAVNVSWTPGFDGNSPIEQFVVQKREVPELGPIPDPLLNWITVSANVSADKRWILLKDLKASAVYQFRVSAVNSVGEGSPSEASNQVALPQEAPSGPPIGFVGSARSSSEIIIQWQQPLEQHRNGPIHGYVIRYRLYGYNDSPWTVQNITNSAQKNFLIQDLITWKDYIVQIAAYNSKGVGVFTEGAKIKTKEGIPEAPPQIRRVEALNSTTVEITWQPPDPQKINGINQGYKIQAWRYNREEDRNIEAKMVTVHPNLLDPYAEETAIISGLDKFTEYNISVLCFTDPGDGVTSDYVYVKTAEDVPDEVTQLQFDEISDRTVRVSWRPPKHVNGHLVSYHLTYQIKDQPDTTRHLNLSADTFSVKIDDLRALTHYRFEIAAATTVGVGPITSAIIQSGIEPVLPHAPTKLALSNIEAFSVVVQFTPGFDGNASITKWTVEGVTARNATWTLLLELSDPEATTIHVTGLIPFTVYRLRVIAHNVVGASPPSDATKEFQTIQAPPAHPPRNVTVRAMTGSATELRVRWIPLQQIEWYGNPRGYNITYRIVGGEKRVGSKWIDDHTANSYVLGGLEEYEVYEVTMVACNDVGCSAVGGKATEKTRESVPSFGPIHVEANATSSTTIVVRWGDVPKQHRNGLIEGYKVYYAAETETAKSLLPPVQYKLVPNNATFTTTLTELRKFVLYRIQVLAYTRLGDGEPSRPAIGVRTFEDVPGPPSNVSFPDVSSTSARIIWDVPVESNGEILAYKIIYHINSTRPHHKSSKEFSPTDRTFRFTQLDPETYYRFSVTARTRLGWGRTAIALVYTTNNRDAPQAPSAPQIAHSHVQSRRVTFNWTPGRDGYAPLRYYTVQKMEIGNDTERWQTLPEKIDPQATSYTVDDLKPFTSYKFRIQATNDIGPSPFSAESLEVRTYPAAPSKAVTNLKVVPVTTSSVEVYWEPIDKQHWNGDDKHAGYRVFYELVSDYPAALPVVPKKEINGIDKNECRLTELMQDSNYEIRVVAFNSQGEGPATPPVTVYVGEAVPTGEPRDLEAEALSSTEVRLKWRPPEVQQQNGELLGYKIFYLVTESPQEGGSYEEETEVVAPTMTSHSLVFLDKYTQYRIQILAFNGAGDGPRSQPISVRTLQGLPGVPMNLRFEDITMTSLVVLWDPPEKRNGAIVGYLVTYETSEDNDKYSKQVKQKVDTTVLQVGSLEEEVTYTFTVRAQTIIGYGPAITCNVTTGPQEGSPVVLKEVVVVRAVTGIDFYWVNGASGRGAILGYYFEARKKDDSRWQTVTRTTNGPLSEFSISYQSLLPSTSYNFRVFSYNQYGISYPAYSVATIITPSRLHLEYGYLQRKPFYRQTWFMVALAAFSIIVIVTVIAILCVKSKSYKYKQEARKTLEESMAMSVCGQDTDYYRTGNDNIGGNHLMTLSSSTISKRSTSTRKSPSNHPGGLPPPLPPAILGRSPPRPSPASVPYNSDEESLKGGYDENPDDSSATEKPSEMSSSDSQGSESENESIRSSDPQHSFVNHYANVNDTLRQSWKRQRPVRNYSSYTDSEPEGSAVVSLNGGQIIVNNMARSRAPLPGFSSFV